jgi:hypothetical protein
MVNAIRTKPLRDTALGPQAKTLEIIACRGEMRSIIIIVDVVSMYVAQISTNGYPTTLN